MDFQLTVSSYVERDYFYYREYKEIDDIFVLVCEGRIRIESEGRSFTVCEGEGVLFRRGVFYRREVLSPFKMFLFRYRGEGHAFSEDHVVFRDRERVRSTVSMLNLLRQGIYKNDFELRSHLFSDLVMQYALENPGGERGDALIERAVGAITAELHRGVDLYALAEQSGLSYVQFLRRFKSYTGMTPSEYLNSARLQKAKTLLSESTLLVREIAFACGFENEYYFSNFFKKHTKTSPSAFRLLSK